MIVTLIRKILTIFILLCISNHTYAEALIGQGSCSAEPNKIQQCIDTTPCKILENGYTVCLSGVTPPQGALSINAHCWSYKTTYVCQDSAFVDTCSNAPWMQQYGSACQQTNVTCATTDPSTGRCTAWTLTYSCTTEPAVNDTVMQCTSSSYNIPLDIPDPPFTPNSPAKAGALLEAARQISTYSTCDPATAAADPDACLDRKMFNGQFETCEKGYWGIKNCCKPAPGGQSNSALTSVAVGGAFSVAKFAGSQLVDTLSPYAFDAMYSGAIAEYAQGFATSVTSASSLLYDPVNGVVGTSFASSGFTFGAYGFTYGTGTFSSSFGAMKLMSFDGGGYLSFNPYVFAGTVALMVIQSLAECTNEEQLLAQHKGSNLSVQVNEVCSAETFWGECMEWTEGWCSYNGPFAKIMATQGKAQLGQPLDTSCSGISIREMQNLDWSSLDMSEMVNMVTNRALENMPNSSTISSSYKNILNTTPINGANLNTQTGLGYPSTYQP